LWLVKVGGSLPKISECKQALIFLEGRNKDIAEHAYFKL